MTTDTRNQTFWWVLWFYSFIFQRSQICVFIALKKLFLQISTKNNPRDTFIGHWLYPRNERLTYQNQVLPPNFFHFLIVSQIPANSKSYSHLFLKSQYATSNFFFPITPAYLGLMQMFYMLIFFSLKTVFISTLKRCYF